jgi:hypothetical protein
MAAQESTPAQFAGSQWALADLDASEPDKSVRDDCVQYLQDGKSSDEANK